MLCGQSTGEMTKCDQSFSLFKTHNCKKGNLKTETDRTDATNTTTDAPSITDASAVGRGRGRGGTRARKASLEDTEMSEGQGSEVRVSDK